MARVDFRQGVLQAGPGKLEKKECPVVGEVLRLDILFWRGLVLFSKGHIKP